MGLEQRDAGRWRRDGASRGKRPATVSEATQQAGEAQPPAGIRARWDWAEPTVWTERMLTALETGVKGGKWFRLIDKVYFHNPAQNGYGVGLLLLPDKVIYYIDSLAKKAAAFFKISCSIRSRLFSFRNR